MNENEYLNKTDLSDIFYILRNYNDIFHDLIALNKKYSKSIQELYEENEKLKDRIFYLEQKLEKVGWRKKNN